MPTQGMLAGMISKSPLSNINFISGNMPTADWKFGVKAKNTMLPVNYRPHNLGRRGENGQPFHTGFRHCPWERESQDHVFNHCPHGVSLRNKRHDLILDILESALIKLGIEYIRETPYPGTDSIQEPDLVINVPLKRNTIILDVKSPYDKAQNFATAKAENEAKYRDLALTIHNVTNRNTTVKTFCVGALGSWDPDNDAVLEKLGFSKAQIRKLASKSVNCAISTSHSIFRNHVNGPEG